MSAMKSLTPTFPVPGIKLFIAIFLYPFMNLLPRDFYTRTDVLQISKDLLGKVLVTQIGGHLTSVIISETEAYRAPDDQACHAWKNRRTSRTETMFARGGSAYVYLCYGIHHLFNVVTAKEETAHAVLIRAGQALDGTEQMLQRRGFSQVSPQLTAGPGVMSKALGIRTSHDGVDLTDKNSPIWIENRGIEVEPTQIATGPRVGVAFAGESAELPWRFWLKDSPWVSKWKR